MKLRSVFIVLLHTNHLLDRIRRLSGFGYWSLTAWIKGKVADARRYIASFEQAAARAAERAGCDGVICGHLHHAAVRDIDGVLYCNDGDWVESCTALVEDPGGRLTLVRWTEMARTANIVDQPMAAAGATPIAARISAASVT